MARGLNRLTSFRQRLPFRFRNRTASFVDDPASIPWTRRRGKVKLVDSPG